MIDFFDLADHSNKSQVFYTKGTTDWQIWQKPNMCKMVMILCMGGGAGGGLGQQAAPGNTRRGGGGGGSAGYVFGLFSANQLPDILYLQPGPGGLPGTSGTGGVGSLSYVSIQANTTPINILLQSGNAAATAGVLGSSGGTAGSAGTAWSGGVLSDLGIVTAYTGQPGGTGQTNATPPAITPSRLTSGAPGGGGVNLSVTFNGGAIQGSGFLPSIPGGLAAGGVHGSEGYNPLNSNLNGMQRSPLIFTGGSGGASSNSGTGGDGGAGAYGSGGGGGGAGTSFASGAGGAGGDGLIIITSY